MADDSPDTASPPAGDAPTSRPGRVQNAQGKWVFATGNHAARSRKGIHNKVAGTIKTFAQELLMSDDYKKSATNRILAGTAPHLETLLHHYAWGKPADTLKVTGDRPPFLLVLGPRRDPLAEGELPDEPLALPPSSS